MDKHEKKVLQYFLNKGRAKSVEAHILQKEVGIPLNKFGDVIGSCVSRSYLWHSPDARGPKHDQYGLSEVGLHAIDDEMKNAKRNLYRKISIIVSIAVLVATLVAIFVTLGIITLPEKNPIEENFDTKIVGDFTELLELDMTTFFTTHSAQPTLYVEGVVPNPGWVRITVENFTHHIDYEQDALQLKEVKMYKKIEFSVDRGNFQEEVILPLSFTWKRTIDYPYEYDRETHGPMGNIFLKAEYYDSTKQSYEIFYLQPYIRAIYYSP